MEGKMQKDVEREKRTEKILCKLGYCDRSKNRGSSRLALIDLDTGKSVICYERLDDTSSIESVKSYDNQNALFSVGGRKIFSININSGKLDEVLSDEGYVKFTRPHKGYFAYATRGDLYLFNLKSQKKTLLATSDKPIGCVTANSKNLIFTRVLDDSDGFSLGSGYEEEHNTRLELLIDLCLDGTLIRQLGNIKKVRKADVSSMAISDNGDLSLVLNRRYVSGSVDYSPKVPLRGDLDSQIRDIDYLNNFSLVIAGRFVKNTDWRECRTEYLVGLRVLDKKGEVIHEIKTDGMPNSISVVK